MSVHRVGLISDTHGLMRPEALAALADSEHIVHAGDIGSAAILSTLAIIAPVTAVRGNNDHGDWAQALPETATLRIGGLVLHVLHDLSALAIDPAAQGIAVVVSGHSHHPRIERRGGVLYVNPGSAGPRRFKLPIAVARLAIDAEQAHADLIELPIAPR